MPREKIELFEYNNKGKFIVKHDSYASVRRIHYDNTKFPLFVNKSEYHILPNGDVLVKSRVGRDAIKFIIAMEASQYVNMYQSKHSNTKILVFNLIGEKLAEFKNMAVAAKMLNISQNKISRSVHATTMPSGRDKLIFRADNNEE